MSTWEGLHGVEVEWWFAHIVDIELVSDQRSFGKYGSSVWYHTNVGLYGEPLRVARKSVLSLHSSMKNGRYAPTKRLKIS